MPRKEFTEKIGSNVYTFKQLRLSPARELMETLGKIAESVSEPLSKPGIKADSDVAPGIISSTVAALVRSFGADTGGKALSLLFEESFVQRDGAPKLPLGDIAEDHFGEFFGELVPFVSFALKNQFGPFVQPLAALLPTAAKLKAMQGMASFLGKSATSTPSEGQH